MLCSIRISSAAQFESKSIQRVRALRKSSEIPSKRSRTPLPILKSAISLRYRTRRGPCTIAGTCAGSLITQLFAEVRSFRNDRTFPAANFQFVAVGIFEEKCVVARTVIDTDFRPLQIFAADFSHAFGNFIHLLTRVGPECDACVVWPVISILRKSKKFRGLVASRRIKGMEIIAWTFVNESE